MAGGRGGDESGKAVPAVSLFLFDTTHAAMEAEEAIIDAGYWCEIVPRPPEARTTLCGLAIEVHRADEEGVAGLLNESQITFDVYRPEEADASAGESVGEPSGESAGGPAQDSAGEPSGESAGGSAGGPPDA